MHDGILVTPPFDPELVPVLEAVRSAIPPVNADTLLQVRQQTAEAFPGMEPPDLTAGGAVRVEDLTVPGPEGAPDITLLVLRPAGGSGPWPVIYNTHGGGMVSGTRRVEISNYLPYVAEGLAVVVSVEYRLAPENPDPAPVEDCYAALAWTARHASELSADPCRIMIAGASAGGGLAAGTALLARDRCFPTLTHQVLICPMLDDRFQTSSSRMLQGSGIWDRNDNLFGWTALLGERRGGPNVSIYAAPARTQDLTGLPKTYIDVGGAESFRDEALIYAQRLSEAGVSVDFHLWAGGFHGFDMIAPQAELSQAARWVRDDYFRRALSA